MWFPSHNLNDRTTGAFRLFALALLVVASGCASFTPYPNARLSGYSLMDSTESGERAVQDTPEIAAHPSTRSIVSAPEPFAWKREADSAGGRPIQVMTIGSSGYRTLIVGNLGGNDPLAVKLTEQLAEYLHSNSLIMGGIQTTIIRNANPDGLADGRFLNDNDVYLNRQFPNTEGDYAGNRIQHTEPEVRFILGQIDDLQPQRVLHIRSYRGKKGVIASSAEAMESATDVAEWLQFEHRPLPGRSPDGTLETFLASGNSRQIVTVAIPMESDQNKLWQQYGDALLNLLLSDDYQTRALARQFNDQSSADNRFRKPAFNESEMPGSGPMFSQDGSSSEVEDLPTLPWSDDSE